MNAGVQKRQQRASAARVLLSLHAKGNLEDPSRWTWDAVDRLPSWCLSGVDERTQLQLTCGVMYLSPDMRFWINKSALLAVQNLIGEALLERILVQADDMQLPRESAAELIAATGIDPASCTAEEIQNLLMATGSTVLTATVHESLPRTMLTASLGTAIGEITEESASVFLQAAELLLHEIDPLRASAV